MRLTKQRKFLMGALGLLVLLAAFFAWKRYQAAVAFREGVAAFYNGDLAQCEKALLRSLSVKRDKKVEMLLSDLLIGCALRCLRAGDAAGAIEAMRKAANYCPNVKNFQSDVQCLTERGLLPSSEHLLQNLAKSATKPMGGGDRSPSRIKPAYGQELPKIPTP